MSDLCKVTIKPDNIIMQVPPNILISKILSSSDIHTEMPCGGIGKCGKCKIIASGNLSELSETEKNILTEEQIARNIRLSCISKITGDAEIFIPDDSKSIRQNILTFNNTRDTNIISAIKKVYVTLPEPNLGEDASEAKRLELFLEKTHHINAKPDFKILPHFSKKIRDFKYSFTAVIYENDIIDIEQGDTSEQLYGIAFDLGSTTIAGYLINLISGEVLSVNSLMNPQIIYGDDLISRINFISQTKDGLYILHKTAWEALSKLAFNLCQEGKISTDNVYFSTIVGNTCMCHIAMGIDPFTLGFSPYIPTFADAVTLPAHEMDLKINNNGKIKFLPSIAGFVGADTVGVILSEMPENTDETILAVDIGTNGEMALWHNGKLTVCSSAAGPAFEGAGISCGMRGGRGAIDSVKITDDIHCNVIGNVPALGICGSGLIDAVDKLIKAEIIDMTGRLMDKEEFYGHETLKERIIEGEKGTEFILVYGKDSGTGYNITLKHSDIRNLQLAKGSIHAAIKTLLSKENIDETNLDKLLLAGGFGNYLSKEAAVGIGLLPNIDIEKIIPIGNAAGSGARLALVSKEEFEKSVEIANIAEHIELALLPEYQLNLMDCMMFY